VVELLLRSEGRIRPVLHASNTRRLRLTGSLSSPSLAFWLELSPAQPLVGEGIGQHTGRLLHAFTHDLGIHCLLVTPAWARGTVEEFLDANAINPAWVTLVFVGSPVLARLLDRRFGVRARVRQPRRRGAAPSLKHMPPTGGAVANVRALARRVARGTFRRYREHLLRRMATHIDGDRNVRAVLVPIGTWDGALAISRTPCIVGIPDVVFFEFPEHFVANPDVPRTIEAIRAVGRHAHAIVCVSEHVRTTHLVEKLGFESGKVHVVRHATMTLDHIFAGAIPSRGEARRLLTETSGAAIPTSDDAMLLYYPTQNRPYKNLSRVIAAIDLLVRVHGYNAHVMLTADISSTPDLGRLIRDLGVDGRVHLLGRLGQFDHACAYRAADVALTASYFEGGFPFTLAEGHSVGTPVVMARIPVTAPEIPADLAERMLFDPDDAGDLALKIMSANRNSALLVDQATLLKSRFDRTWADVARDYLRLIATSEGMSHHG
jgi:glycosyltransferase involved in cell wall biosynthesis